MANKHTLVDVERLAELAQSSRPLTALPARRAILEWVKEPESFESETALSLAMDGRKNSRAEPADQLSPPALPLGAF